MDQREAKSTLYDRLAVVGKAFASAKRLEIIDLLTQGERTVESLATEAGLGVSTTSAHLQILKMANLVSTRRDGTRIHYSLVGEDVATLYSVMRTVARTRSADVARALDAYLGTGGIGDVEEVSREELVGRLNSGNVMLLDVRPAEEFAAGHIKGARSFPFGDLSERIPLIDDESEIIAYCRGAYCVMANDAVRLLQQHHQTARRLEEGMLEWRLAGLPVEAGLAPVPATAAAMEAGT